MAAWYDQFFGGLYSRVLAHQFDDETTLKQARLVKRLLKVRQGARAPTPRQGPPVASTLQAVSSIWRETGHFYFALTTLILYLPSGSCVPTLRRFPGTRFGTRFQDRIAETNGRSHRTWQYVFV